MNRKQSVSIVSVSALAAGMAQGAVTYSGLINTTLPKGSGGTIQIDLNGDSTGDFTLGFDGVANPGPNNSNKPYIAGSPDSAPGSTPLAQLASDGSYGLPVTPFGTLINSSYLTPVPDTAPGPARAYLNQDNNSSASYPIVGAWGVNSPTEGYVGLEMYDNNGLSFSNFGWVRLIYNNNLGTLTLVDYAYETTPGVGIVAGATHDVDR